MMIRLEFIITREAMRTTILVIIHKVMHLKFRVSKFTFWSKRTEASHKIVTDHLSRVFITTLRSMLAKSTIIPWALFSLLRGINVQVDTIGIGTFTIVGIEPALGHPLQVILMQKLTLIALLAQIPQPMLAHDHLLRFDVSILAVISMPTISLQVEFTNLLVRPLILSNVQPQFIL